MSTFKDKVAIIITSQCIYPRGEITTKNWDDPYMMQIIHHKVVLAAKQ
jgi:hypothetical protein